STSTSLFYILRPPPPRSSLFPYTTLFRSETVVVLVGVAQPRQLQLFQIAQAAGRVRIRFCRAYRRQKQGCQDTYDRDDDQQLDRSEEHTSELQSRFDLVCRLLLEKKKKKD